MKQTIASWKAGVILSVLLGCGFGVSTAYADDTMWAVTQYGIINKIDVQTGAVTLVGNAFPDGAVPPLGGTVRGLAFDPSENLFGISLSDLFTVNQSTGQATLVGAFGNATIVNATFGPNGVLYGSGGNDLYSINTTTGKTTDLGSIGQDSYGLAFVNGKLYNYTGDDSANPFSLQVIDLADLSKSKIIPVSGLPDPFVTIASPHPYGDALYAIEGFGTHIYSINPFTGVGSVVSNAVESVGATFMTESVPEPSTIAFIGLAAAGLVGRMACSRKANSNA